MLDSQTPVASFFRRYADYTTRRDIAALAAQFAPTFLAVGPQGATCVRNHDFAMALPKRYQQFDSLGCRSTELTRLEVTALDSRYCAARTQWKMTFPERDRDQQHVVVDSTYMVDTGVDPYQIILYLAHQDVLAMLRQGAAPPSQG